MNKYTISHSKGVRLVSGILKLTKEQAAPRLHNLEFLGNGRYQIVHPVEFKTGEVIGFEGELPRNLANLMESAGKKKAKTSEADRLAAEEAEAARLAAEEEANKTNGNQGE